MLPMFSELDNLGSDAEASDAGNKPESVVDSNIGFYFNFMRNQPQTKSKTSSVSPFHIPSKLSGLV